MTIVVEAGTQWTRLGIAGEQDPSTVWPSVIARADAENSPPVYGFDVLNDPKLDIYTPVVEEVVHDWDQALGLWQAQARTQGLALEEAPLALVEPITNPSANRVRALEHVFGAGVPVFSLVSAPLATAFESGKTTALVATLGESGASVVPIIDGSIQHKAVLTSRLGTDFLSAHVEKEMRARGVKIVPPYMIGPRQRHGDQVALLEQGTESFHAFAVSRVLRTFNQTVLHAAESATVPALLRAPGAVLDETAPASGVPLRSFQFATGETMRVGAERMQLLEPLFSPSLRALGGERKLGVSELLYETVSKTEASPDVVASLLNNIVLVGEGMALPGVARRIENDMIQILPNQVSRFHLPRNRLTATWTGASVLASLNTFDHAWATKLEYEEHGAEHLAAQRFQ